MMNIQPNGIWLKYVALAAVFTLVFVGFSNSALAAGGCTKDNLVGQTTIEDNGTTAFVTVKNITGETCTVIAGSYNIWGPGNQDQDLFDNGGVRHIAPGATATWNLNLACDWQVDVLLGDNLPFHPAFSGGYLIGKKIGSRICATTPPPPPPAPHKPTADIKANNSNGPITIPSGSAAVLTWTSTNASTCVVNPGGFSGISGTQSTGALTASQTYTVTCVGTGGSATDSVTVNVSQQALPPIVTLVANPSIINAGNTSLLTWSSTNATTCSAFGGWSGNKALAGNETVTPSVTTSYFIICTNAMGQAANAEAVVTVVQNQPVTPTLTLTANPNYINQGQNSTLIWNSQNTTSCSASGGWSGTRTLSGSEVVYPPVTTTYSMTCYGTNGQQVSAQATVVVNSYNPPPIYQQPTVTLTANPNYINQGQNSTLNWYSTNANTCFVYGGWSGNRALSGSEVVYPSVTTTYTITCTNGYGTATDSETIVVNQNYYNPPNYSTNIAVAKFVRNVTLNQFGFSNATDAASFDILEFEIRVRNQDGNTATNVMLRDLLPQELILLPGSTQVNGNRVIDGVIFGGINLGSLNPFEEKVIRLRTTVVAGALQRTVTNQAIATTGSGFSRSGFANVNIRPRGQVLGVADIVTGPEDSMLWILSLGFLATLAFHVFVVKRGRALGFPYAPSTITPYTKSTTRSMNSTDMSAMRAWMVHGSHAPVRPRAVSTENEASTMISEIRARESRPDTEAVGQESIRQAQGKQRANSE